MFDTLLIITLFLLASLLVCLLTLKLSINIKHLCLFFHSLPIITNLLKFRPPRLLNLTKISNPPVYFDPLPLLRHLRVKQQLITFQKFTRSSFSKEQQKMHGKKSLKKGFSFTGQKKRKTKFCG